MLVREKNKLIKKQKIINEHENELIFCEFCGIIPYLSIGFLPLFFL